MLSFTANASAFGASVSGCASGVSGSPDSPAGSSTASGCFLEAASGFSPGRVPAAFSNASAWALAAASAAFFLYSPTGSVIISEMRAVELANSDLGMSQCLSV